MSANVISLVRYRAFKDELEKIAKSGGLEKTALVGALVKGVAKLAPKAVKAVRGVTKKVPKLLPKGKPVGARGGFVRPKSLPTAKPLGARGGPAPRRAPPPPSRGQVQPPTMSGGNLAKQRAARAGKPMPEATPMGGRQSGQKFVPKGRVMGQREVASPVAATRDLPTPSSKVPKATPLGQRQTSKRFVPTRPAPTPTAPPAPPTRLRPKRQAPPPAPRRLRPAA